MSIKKVSKVTIKGYLNTDGDKISVETESLGDRDLKTEIESFNGKNVSIVVTLNSEVTE